MPGSAASEIVSVGIVVNTGGLSLILIRITLTVAEPVKEGLPLSLA